MKGKILGANADGGTISAEDGKRYKFELMQWNSDRPPAAGQEVDFELDNAGRAIDVFPLRAGATIELGQVGDRVKELIGDGAASPIGGQIIALVTGSAQFQISLVILVVSFFFTFVKLTSGVVAAASAIMPDNGAYTVFNLSDLIDYLKTSLDQAANAAQQITGMMGPMANALDSGTASGSGNPQSAIDGLHTLSAITNLFYLAYLAPLGAVAVIVQLIRGRPAGIAAFAAGAASILAFVALFAWRWAFVSAMKSAGNASAADMAGRAIQFGFGAWIILLCGLALIGAACGFIKLPERH